MSQQLCYVARSVGETVLCSLDLPELQYVVQHLLSELVNENVPGNQRIDITRGATAIIILNNKRNMVSIVAKVKGGRGSC